MITYICDKWKQLTETVYLRTKYDMSIKLVKIVITTSVQVITFFLKKKQEEEQRYFVPF